MDLGLSGKCALVVGASEGIGKAVARALAEEHVNVAMCSRRQGPIAEAAREIESATGSRVVPVTADISNAEDVSRLVARTVEAFGTIHILVNCAAISIFGSFLELDDEAWETVLQTKYLGYVRCMRQVLPIMIKQKDGRIVNFSGRAGKEPTPMHLPGGSVNAAINQISKGLAREMGKYNIRINTIAPGPVATERLRQRNQVHAAEDGTPFEKIVQESAADVPLGRFAQPREIADVAVFLVSDRASFVTGACVIVDGGRTRSV